MNIRGWFTLFCCVLLFCAAVSGSSVHNSTGEDNDSSPLSYGYAVSRTSSTDTTTQTIVTDLDVENRFLYGEKGLNVCDTFDAMSIPLTYDRAAAREAMGYDLYLTTPSLHHDILMAYQARYPELSLPFGSTQYIYHYGNRLTLEFRPDGTLGIGRFSIEYADTPPEPDTPPFHERSVSEKLRDHWEKILKILYGDAFDVIQALFLPSNR